MSKYSALNFILGPKPQIILDKTYTVNIFFVNGTKVTLPNITYNEYIAGDDTYEFGNDYDTYVYPRRFILCFDSHEDSIWRKNNE